MLVLGIDTSSAQVAVALHDGRTVLARRTEGDGRRHAERLAPAIAGVLDDAGVRRGDVTDVAAGVGPGPYTSLRIGLVTARVFARALGLPVWGVCSLDVVAEQALQDDAVVAALSGERSGAPAGASANASAGRADLIVATDARRREVYWARYRLEAGSGADTARRPVRVSGPEVGPAAEVPVAGAVVTGRGVTLYGESFGGAGVPGPQGVDAGTLAGLVAAEVGHPVGRAVLDTAASRLVPVEPLYLRPPDAVEPTTRKRVLGPV